MADRLHQAGPRLRTYIDTLDTQAKNWRAMLEALGGQVLHLRTQWRDHQFEEFQRQVRGSSEILTERITMIEKEKVELYELARLADIFDKTNF